MIQSIQNQPLDAFAQNKISRLRLYENGNNLQLKKQKNTTKTKRKVR